MPDSNGRAVVKAAHAHLLANRSCSGLQPLIEAVDEVHG